MDNFESSEPPQNLIDHVNRFRHRLFVSGELAREKLAKAQGKMKHLYDQWAERHKFSPGNQVLALLMFGWFILSGQVHRSSHSADADLRR